MGIEHHLQFVVGIVITRFDCLLSIANLNVLMLRKANDIAFFIIRSYKQITFGDGDFGVNSAIDKKRGE